MIGIEHRGSIIVEADEVDVTGHEDGSRSAAEPVLRRMRALSRVRGDTAGPEARME
jgi:hypothetical protein